MKEKLTLVKVGGKIVENPETLAAFVDIFAALPGAKVLVHGGGRTATDIAARLGIETHMVNGRRVTDANMLDVVTMVYGGLVNKNIVASLSAHGCCALGLTGADMDVIRSRRRPAGQVDYGFVGDPVRVDGERLAGLIRSGVIPIMAPLTHNGEGDLLNTNADTIAGETAKGLAALFDVTLIYCFEHAGVLSDPNREDSVIGHIDPKIFDELVQNGTVSGGMIPKLENCLSAVRAGVSRVIITRADLLGTDSGTTITL